jgi:hypothetical protein
MYGAFGVLDSACMVQFSSNFEKVKIICKTAMVCQKIKNACGVNA